MYSKITFFLISMIFLLPAYADTENQHSDSSVAEHHAAAPAGHSNHSEHGSSAAGQPADFKAGTRTVSVTLLDTMRFEFSEPLEIKVGEVIRFVVSNKGIAPHEFFIGTDAEQQEHSEMMRNMPGMVHSDGNTITVAAGETKGIVWRFTNGGPVIFACNIPGHFEAGMFRLLAVAS